MTTVESTTGCDRLRELRAFDETKAGVKGLVDNKITKIPSIFVRPPEELALENRPSGDTKSTTKLAIPVIDLGSSNRAEIVNNIRQASESFGFFQVVNHGIPTRLSQEMLKATRAFHKLPKEEKMELYSREFRRVKFDCNFDLYKSKYANWRDSLVCILGPDPLDPLKIPATCRVTTLEYSKHAVDLGTMLFKLLSEALGLEPDHLINMDCAKGHLILSHYDPKCPEPELAMGTSKHTDPAFFAILLQDHVGGLQVLYNDTWIDVIPVDRALVVNIGDLLQLVTNGKFKSVEHRAVVKSEGPRISVAYFFRDGLSSRIYGPIKELLSDENPAIYKETTTKDYLSHFLAQGLNSVPSLQHLRL